MSELIPEGAAFALGRPGGKKSLFGVQADGAVNAAGLLLAVQAFFDLF